MPTVTQIEWTSEPAREAEVSISDGRIVCFAFCQPCGYQAGDPVTEPIHIFALREARLSKVPSAYIEKISAAGLGQRGAGTLINVAQGELAIGNLRFVFDDHLPGGLTDGDMVEFECGRIDLW